MRRNTRRAVSYVCDAKSSNAETVNRRLSPADRREAAAAWLVQLESPEATEADWTAFQDWLTDPDNKRSLEQIEAALAVVADHGSALREAYLTRRPSEARRAYGNAMRAILYAGLAAAAAAFILVVFNPSAEVATFAAPAGAIRNVRLPDGSVVTLNRGAIVAMRWSARERRLDLRQGEAAFNVVHNPDLPFIVAAGDAIIHDVGTEFDVLRDRNRLTVTVNAGAVNLEAGETSSTLASGDQARFVDGSLTVRSVDPSEAFAWRDGRLIYHDALLSDVVTDLNRYSATPIRVADEATASLRFTGALTIDRPTAMIERLEAFLPIRSEQNGDGIELRSR